MAIKSARYGGFSESAAKESLWGTVVYKQETQYTYDFANYFHPYVSELLQQLNRKSIDGLLDLDFLEGLHAAFFDAIYAPNESDRRVVVDSHEKSIDVGHDGLRGPYAIYNWELLFHVPLIIAVHLSKNQRFAEAQKWFHYIFDPTSDDGRFWRFLAFADAGDPTDVAAAMRLLSKPDDECTDTELALKQSLLNGYEAVREDPFQPHKVARTRLIAYQYSVVMKYLDNLIAWGDSLFRQDTMESTAEATQIYVLAANLLGPRPERVPPRGVVKAKSFAQLKAAGLDVLGNSLVELEGQFPFNLYEPAADETGTGNPLFGIGRTLYFCIPRNDKLLGYWDTVADRLFKLRHCLNIEGVFRQLPLFQPPLDPGMLVKAAAAGLDISSLVSGLNQPLAPVRCRILIQKAIELAGEVRGMGQALLSAMEKKDAESLARLRQKHEIAIQKLAQDVAFLQWKDAEATTDALAQSRDAAVERYLYYKRLLGIDTANPPDEIKDAVAFTLDRSAQLTEESFDEVYAGLVGQYVHDAPLESFPALEVIDEGNLYLNKHEDEELNVEMPVAFGLKTAAGATDVITAALYYIPNFNVDVHYWGIGADSQIAGGEFLGHAGQAVASGLRTGAEVAEHLGAEAAKQAAYQRRAEDWKLQANLAAHELVLIGRQLIGSLIKEQVARHEYERVKVQIAQAEEVDQFLHDKFTNAELYTWMQGELAKLYYEHYKFAFDVARKAEQTLKFELMRPELDQLSFVKFNYWDGGRKGLLAGESLQVDLRRMEMAYYDNNKREYELTKHVSLRQLDPMALLALKAGGRCEVSIPEWLYDLDGAGHYMRRIKSVSLSIPAVAGPYTGVNCTLSLLKSSLRRSAALKDDEYVRASDEADERFIDYYGAIASIVTSSGQNDSGLFETNLNDERFLPFEGAGAISTWRLELPNEYRQFDYNTITDVILHIRYTARQGGESLRKKATDAFKLMVEDTDASQMVRLFSLKHDFPTEWYRFVSGTGDFQASVKADDFPYLTAGRSITLTSVELGAIAAGALSTGAAPGVDVDALTTALHDHGVFSLELAENASLVPRSADANVFVAVRYALG